MLIRNFSHIQSTGLRVSMLDEDSQLPDISTAEQQFIIPAIGQTLYNALDELLNLLEAPPPPPPDPLDEQEPEPPTPPDENLLNLLPRVQKPLAAFAYMADLPAIHTRLTSAGLRQTTSDGMPTAYRWQYDQMKAYLEERAYHTLEQMLQFLYDNATIYDEWINQDLLTMRTVLLFKSGNDFGKYYRLQQPYRTYMHLLPIIDEVIDQYLAPSVGRDFLEEISAMENPDDDTFNLLTSLRYAAANIAISKAAQKLPFRISPEGFTIINNIGSANMTATEQNVQVKDMGYLQKHTLADGEQYLRRAVRLLQTKASAELWNTFFDSDLYKGPDAYQADSGNSRRKIFRL